MKTVIGIDNGTQSTKVIFYDFENKAIVTSASSAHDLISTSNGTNEQKAKWWIDALERCFSDIDSDIKKTAVAIGVSGQQHGFVPLDGDGNVLYNVKLWCDTSTAAECSEIENSYGTGENVLTEVGNRILPGYTASKILWFKKNYPDLYNKMKHILLPHDYINYYLTGKYTMEYGDASGTGLLNIHNKKWDKDVIHALDSERDLTKSLPSLIEAHESAGRVTNKVSLRLGIPSGIIVSSGGGDNMMGAIGTGATEPGVITMSLGTSGTIYGYSDKPVIDKEGNLAAFCSSTGGYLPLLCTMNCTVATEQMRSLFVYGVKEFDEIASKAPAGSDGIITLPFFSGERTPNLPNGKGCIVGMDMTNTKKENIFKSSLESAVFGMRLGLESFRDLGFKVEELRLIGGGAKSAVWRQIASDILNLPVVVPVQEEAAALGAAIQALWARDNAEKKSLDINYLIKEHVSINTAKGCNPIPENVAIYNEVYKTYNKYVDSLSGIFR
ncbi:MAG: xylulokinase [Spirochaetaceae bacterium]|nr:xylulokinase [Spirochaetaceae bacterium]